LRGYFSGRRLGNFGSPLG
jgi:hypothetical protein